MNGGLYVPTPILFVDPVMGRALFVHWMIINLKTVHLDFKKRL